MEAYRKSDLFCEAEEMEVGGRVRGEVWEEATWGHVRVTRWRGGASVPSTGEETCYCATVQTKPLWQLDSWEYDELRDCLSEELRRMMRPYAEQRDGDLSVMVVGLGNPSLTPDAVGPETVKRIAVSVPAGDVEAGKRQLLSAFAPDVTGNTGIETAELIRGAVGAARPQVVLAVDSLAARSPERLASVIQLSDGGIAPGAGLGNHRMAINEATLGVPVVALGVPTVVSSSAMMVQALTLGGVGEAKGTLRALLEEGRRLFVTPKEIDLIVRSAAILLSDAIHRACGMQT